MLDPLLLFKEGGPFAWLIAGGAPLAAVVAAALFVLLMINRRPPLAGWFVVPGAVVALSIGATAYGYSRTIEALSAADPAVVVPLTAHGRSVSLFVEVLAAGALTPVLLFSVWATGAGGWFAAYYPKRTLKTAAGVAGIGGVVLVLGLLTGLVLGPSFTVANAGPLACFAAGLPAVILAASRRGSSKPEMAATNAEQRLASAVLLLAASATAGWCMIRSAQVVLLQSVAKAASDTRAELLEAGAAGDLWMLQVQLVLIALGGAGIIGWVVQADRGRLDARVMGSLAAVSIAGLVLTIGLISVGALAPALDVP